MRRALSYFLRRFEPDLVRPSRGSSLRLKSCSPADELQRRVGRLVGSGDAVGAVTEVSASLDQCVFSMKAFASALFLCERTKNEAIGMELVRKVLVSGVVKSWDDESVLAVVLRLQCTVGDVPAAMQMFSYMVSHRLLRLRSASTFLTFWCRRRDRRMVFAVYDEALRHGIEFGPLEYLELGRACVAVGEPVETLHRLLRDMREHLMGISDEMAREVVCPWAENSGLCVTAFETPHSDPTLHPGTCGSCGQVLGGHRFTAEQKSRLISDVVKVAMSAQRGKSPRMRLAFESWQRFVSTQGHRIDVLIDGANLGYYGLSSWYEIAKRELLLKRGRRDSDILPEDTAWSKRRAVDVSVNFQLIELAVQEARRRGMQPLVILHERHCESRNITATNEALAAQWRREGVLYCTPSGLNDDLCWLYAALELTTPTDTVPVGGVTGGCATVGEGRAKTVWVLTNDLMRDHHFKLLNPRFFAHWRDRHRISFKCSREDGRTLLHWEMPAPYMRCIQELNPLRWHIPIVSDDGFQEQEGTPESLASVGLLGSESEEEVEHTPLSSSQRWLCVR
ncbi:putative Pentacotripeptide repeat region of PROPR Protein only RNase P [Trypanosoma vivax]|nr:hypothetical protein TRVL_03774 [Trypanosoma vivax]KAH8617942.1 putative Pentacotripeptide repeat region of PROPR Protein only RNase P [Trypanosoma vivax]